MKTMKTIKKLMALVLAVVCTVTGITVNTVTAEAKGYSGKLINLSADNAITLKTGDVYKVIIGKKVKIIVNSDMSIQGLYEKGTQLSDGQKIKSIKMKKVIYSLSDSTALKITGKSKRYVKVKGLPLDKNVDNVSLNIKMICPCGASYEKTVKFNVQYVNNHKELYSDDKVGTTYIERMIDNVGTTNISIPPSEDTNWESTTQDVGVSRVYFSTVYPNSLNTHKITKAELTSVIIDGNKYEVLSTSDKAYANDYLLVTYKIDTTADSITKQRTGSFDVVNKNGTIGNAKTIGFTWKFTYQDEGMEEAKTLVFAVPESPIS